MMSDMLWAFTASVGLLIGISLMYLSMKAFIFSLDPRWGDLKRSLPDRYIDYLMGRNYKVDFEEKEIGESSIEYGIGISKDGRIENRSKVTKIQIDEIF